MSDAVRYCWNLLLWNNIASFGKLTEKLKINFHSINILLYGIFGHLFQWQLVICIFLFRRIVDIVKDNIETVLEAKKRAEICESSEF